MRRHCVFLTLAERGDYVIDDDLACDSLNRRGWKVETIAWDSTRTDWSRFDLAVIRSTWDYHLRPREFLAGLRRICSAGVRLENPLEVIEWNINKTYLHDLQRRGVAVVPSRFAECLAPGAVDGYFDELRCDEIVIKPQIGATASGVYRVGRDLRPALRRELEQRYRATPLVAQPFQYRIETEGEYSLFFFNGRFSHAIRKIPRRRDFRSQEEHGARITPVAEPPLLLRQQSGQALAAVDATLLYARVDLVRDNATGQFLLMELELVEPSLYFRTNERAAANFARAVEELFAR